MSLLAAVINCDTFSVIQSLGVGVGQVAYILWLLYRLGFVLCRSLSRVSSCLGSVDSHVTACSGGVKRRRNGLLQSG